MTFLIQEVLLWRATVDEDGHYATPDVRQRSRFRKVVRLPSSATGLPPVTANHLSDVPYPTTPTDRVGAHVDYFPTRATFPK